MEYCEGSVNNSFLYTGKEYDAESGLYYFGARYYDPKKGRWLSRDPKEEFFSSYVYCGNNPLVFVDPDGEEIEAYYYVTQKVHYEEGGTTYKGNIYAVNKTTRVGFVVKKVWSGGMDLLSRHTSTGAPFGKYDILQTTKNGELHQRLEAEDNNYGDDIVSFSGQKPRSNIRLHGKGHGYTFGCLSIRDIAQEKLMQYHLKNTSTSKVEVDSKSIFNKLFGIKKKEVQIKFGTIEVIDATK